MLSCYFGFSLAKLNELNYIQHYIKAQSVRLQFQTQHSKLNKSLIKGKNYISSNVIIPVPIITTGGFVMHIIPWKSYYTLYTHILL